jgi:HSP20 family protein
MANQDVRTNKQQQQQSQENDASRGRQPQGGLVRGSVRDPVWGSLAPGELIRMTPFSIMNPFSFMRRMIEEMDRGFGESGTRSGNGGTTVWMPAIEVSESDGNYVVRAELPGMKPEDVKVEMTDEALVLEGDRKEEREENQGGIRRTELHYGHFYRSVPLPEGANAEQAQARFENGVLEITIPVPKQESNRRQIPVQAASASPADNSQKAA